MIPEDDKQCEQVGEGKPEIMVEAQEEQPVTDAKGNCVDTTSRMVEAQEDQPRTDAKGNSVDVL